MIDSGFGKEFPAPGLCPEGEMARIGPIKWNTETEREVSLEVGGVVAHEMSAIIVLDACGDSLEQAWSLQQLEAKWTRGIVVGREECQALQRVAVDHAREQAEIILDYAGMNRLRRRVDEPGPRLPEEQKEKEKPLFVTLDFEAGHGHLERNRRNDNDCLLILVEAFDRTPKRL